MPTRDETRAQVLKCNPASIRLLQKSGFGLLSILHPTADEPEAMLRHQLLNPG